MAAVDRDPPAGGEADGTGMPERGLFERVLAATRDLLDARSLGELHRLVVERGRTALDIDRLGLLLYDAEREEMLGTWGTDATGRLVDESDFRAPLPEGDDFIRGCLESGAEITIWEDRELSQAGKTVGRGWNAMVPLREGRRVFGWLAADNLLKHRPLRPEDRCALLLYGQFVANNLLTRRHQLELEEALRRKAAEFAERERFLTALHEKADAQNLLKERLFSIVAHDLRGPLGTVRNLFSAIDRGEVAMDDAELRTWLPEIGKSIDAVYGLLDNLLDWVRSQMDEIRVLREELDAGSLLAGVTAVHAATAEAKGVGLQVAACPGVLFEGDRRMVETIVRNLVSNALKFTPAGGLVRIEARRDEVAGTVSLAVTDTGLGMDDATKAALFTMDHAKRREGTAGESGSGIGLMFCADLARRLGGRIEVESAPGAGSRFTLVLPRPPEEELPLLEAMPGEADGFDAGAPPR